MATTAALALIATTLGALVLLTWATLHYVPAVLYEDRDEAPADAGHAN